MAPVPVPTSLHDIDVEARAFPGQGCNPAGFPFPPFGFPCAGLSTTTTPKVTPTPTPTATPQKPSPKPPTVPTSNPPAPSPPPVHNDPAPSLPPTAPQKPSSGPSDSESHASSSPAGSLRTSSHSTPTGTERTSTATATSGNGGTALPASQPNPDATQSLPSSSLVRSSDSDSNPSPAARGGAPSQAHSDQPSTGTLVGIIVPVVILSIILFGLLFLLWRKKRRRDASRPAPEFASVASPYPVSVSAAAGTPTFPEHFTDRSTSDAGSERLSVVPNMTAAFPNDSKRAFPFRGEVSSPTDSDRHNAPSESDRASTFSATAPSPVSMAVSPVEMAELTAAMQRAGLSVNELMSSLNRVSRLDVDRDVGRRSSAGEVMPPVYEA